MKKVLLLMPLSLLIGACSHMDPTGAYTEVDGSRLVHHDSDTKGRAAFPSQRVATGKRVFIFDPKLTAWAAYDESGRRIKTGRASGGQPYCEDVGRPCRTVSGRFSVYSKKGAECKSSKYPIEEGGGAKMPHCMHFHKGYAIHGAYHVPNYNASHGCIRVLPSAARWLNENFVRVGTTVVVRGYGS